MGRDQKGQGKEQRCMCFPSYLLHSLFLECKFFSKAEIIPASAVVWCLVLYYMQYSSTRQLMQVILRQRTIYDEIQILLGKVLMSHFTLTC